MVAQLIANIVKKSLALSLRPYDIKCAYVILVVYGLISSLRRVLNG